MSMTDSGPVTGECQIVCCGLSTYGVLDPNSPTAHLHGLWLAQYDPEANNGEGLVSWTPNRKDARVFPSMAAAMDEWRRVPETRPTRADGKPNRPMTAFHIQTVPLGKEPVL